MSTGGSPILTSLIQTAQAQRIATAQRNRQRQAEAEKPLQYADMVDLRVAGITSTGAVRRLPQYGSEQSEQEHHRGTKTKAPEGHVDVKA
jgi:hypothetical protein